MNSPTPPHAPSHADESRGMSLGLVAVLLFAMTIPMTRMATGSEAAPGLPPLFVAVGRPALAGCLAVLYLLAVRAPWPRGGQWRLLGLMVLGGMVGWSGLLALAMRHVDATHAAVVSGLVPLSTAVVSATWARQRPSLAFWLCAGGACALVIAFAAWRGQGVWVPADGLLLAAVLLCGVGYSAGARLTKTMKPQHTGSWTFALMLPITLPSAWVLAPTQPVAWAAWAGWLYVGIISAWLGMFIWYRAMQLGGAVRVSQVQAVQPFVSMLLAVPLLGEHLDATTLAFGLAVMALVWLGRRQPVY